MSTSLGGLPDELLVMILNQVQHRGSLSNLSLCSRRLHSLAIPLLYSNVVLRGSDDGFVHLRDFTILIFKNPNLASIVRSFTLRTEFRCAKDVWSLEEKGRNCDITVDSALQVAVESLCDSAEETSAWLNALSKRHDEDALLGLLLHALVNLERLELTVPRGANFYEATLRRAVNRRSSAINVNRNEKCNVNPVLGTLASVKNTWNDDDYEDSGLSLKHLSLYLQIPSIRAFFGLRINSPEDYEDGEADPRFGALPSGSSSLTHLELRSCEINALDLKSMIHVCCKTLKTLICELVIGYTWRDPFSPRGIRDALAPLENTLENLCLDFDPSSRISEDDDFHHLTESLAKFTSLKHLKVAMRFLFGVELGTWDGRDPLKILVETLPRGLEKLHLTSYGTDRDVHPIEPALYNLLHQRQTNDQVLPKLTHLSLEVPFFTTESALFFSLEALDSLAASTGVELVKLDHSIRVERFQNSSGWGMDGTIEWADRPEWMVEMKNREAAESCGCLNRYTGLSERCGSE